MHIGLHDPVDERDQSERDGERAGEVEVPAGVGAPPLGDVPARQQRRGHADRHVHEQDPLPAEQVGENAAEQRARGAPGPGHRAPDPEGAVALLALGEAGGEDGQRRGRHHGAAESLGGPGGDQHALALRQPADQRCAGEQQQAGDEDAPSPQQVGRAAAQEQEAGEGQRVGIDHPLEVDLREVQVVTDRRQGDVDDRDVEDDHELPEADQEQRGPAALRGSRHGDKTGARVKARLGGTLPVDGPRRKRHRPARPALRRGGRRNAPHLAGQRADVAGLGAHGTDVHGGRVGRGEGGAGSGEGRAPLAVHGARRRLRGARRPARALRLSAPWRGRRGDPSRTLRVAEPRRRGGLRGHSPRCWAPAPWCC